MPPDLMALVDEGDEVVVFEPWFDIYTAAISMARGIRVAKGAPAKPKTTASAARRAR